MKKFKIAFLSAFITLLFGVSSQALAGPDDPEEGPTGDEPKSCKLPIWLCGGDDDEKER